MPRIRAFLTWEKTWRREARIVPLLRRFPTTLTRSPSRTRRGAVRTVTAIPLCPVVRTMVCARFATTVPLIAFGAALADPTASRKAATASRAVHFID